MLLADSVPQLVVEFGEQPRGLPSAGEGGTRRYGAKSPGRLAHLNAVVHDVVDRVEHHTVAVALRPPRPSSQAGTGSTARTTRHSASVLSET